MAAEGFPIDVAAAELNAAVRSVLGDTAARVTSWRFEARQRYSQMLDISYAQQVELARSGIDQALRQAGEARRIASELGVHEAPLARPDRPVVERARPPQDAAEAYPSL